VGCLEIGFELFSQVVINLTDFGCHSTVLFNISYNLISVTVIKIIIRFSIQKKKQKIVKNCRIGDIVRKLLSV